MMAWLESELDCFLDRARRTVHHICLDELALGLSLIYFVFSLCQNVVGCRKYPISWISAAYLSILIVQVLTFPVWVYIIIGPVILLLGWVLERKLKFNNAPISLWQALNIAVYWAIFVLIPTVAVCFLNQPWYVFCQKLYNLYLVGAFLHFVLFYCTCFFAFLGRMFINKR